MDGYFLTVIFEIYLVIMNFDMGDQTRDATYQLLYKSRNILEG